MMRSYFFFMTSLCIRLLKHQLLCAQGTMLSQWAYQKLVTRSVPHGDHLVVCTCWTEPKCTSMWWWSLRWNKCAGVASIVGRYCCESSEQCWWWATCSMPMLCRWLWSWGSCYLQIIQWFVRVCNRKIKWTMQQVQLEQTTSFDVLVAASCMQQKKWWEHPSN